MSTVTIISNRIWCDELQDYYIESDFLRVLSSPELWDLFSFDGPITPTLQSFFNNGFPPSARIFHCATSAGICDRVDVTPYDEASIKKLEQLRGDFTIIVYPAGPVPLIIAAVVLVAAALAAMFLLRPAIPPTPTMRNTNAESPNNELSSRQNKPRPLCRIEDIYGTVTATPSLLTNPLKTFVGNQEVEDSVLIIGRGSYFIHDDKIRDGATNVTEIPGTTVEIYRPYTAINSNAPYYRVGQPLTTLAMRVERSNSVDGQVLRPPNYATYKGDTVFQYPNTVLCDSPVDEVFEFGDNVTVTNATVYEDFSNSDPMYAQYVYPWGSVLIPYVNDAQLQVFQASPVMILKNARITFDADDGSGGGTYWRSVDISGSYQISSASKVTKTVRGVATDFCEIGFVDVPAKEWSILSTISLDKMMLSSIQYTLYGKVLYTLDGDYIVLNAVGNMLTFENPELVNPVWAELANFPNQQTPVIPCQIAASTSRKIGGFVLQNPNRTHVYCNFVALNGLYKDNGKKQRAVNVLITTEIVALDLNDVPIGTPELFNITLTGSSISKGTRAATLKAETTFKGRCLVTVWRRTTTDSDYQGTVVDEVKWRDLYAIGPLPNDNFGNVTPIKLRTFSTAGALAIKDRKLNLLVTRELPRRISGSDFTTDLCATNNAADILSAVSLDPYIGRRGKNEIDFDLFYALAGAAGEVETYFGTPLATEFNYTIDSNNLSYEETFGMIANAAFCQGYRRGNVVKLFFEKKTDKSVLLFNHRNKVPRTETRITSFGYRNSNDGLIYKYVSPVDDALISIQFPKDGNFKNPKEFESIGIRHDIQAHLQGSRMYNKMVYQYDTAEFDATEIANVLVLGNRILIADNTRPDVQDGEVIGQNALIIETSQPVKMETGGVRYYIFLQMYDGSVETMRVWMGADKYHVVLEKTTKLPLVVSYAMRVRTTYMIVREDKMQGNAFLLTKTDRKDNFYVNITAVNYSDNYYKNDTDVITGKIK